MDVVALLEDLAAEGAELDAIVVAGGPDAAGMMTPSAGWTVAHQIAHLSWTDEIAIVAATDPGEFGHRLRKFAENPNGVTQDSAAEGAAAPFPELLERWRAGRTAIIDVLRRVPAGTKLPWFGPPMSTASMATARLMETWAHGQDIVDALGAERVPTSRLRHIAHLGVRTIGFAFLLHGIADPEEPFRVELTGPDGELWTWGEPDAPDRITGPALDFSLLVTQRRHPDDLAIVAEGARAREWVPIAQAFAGPPGTGRKAGQFA
jgi:uncharacterized protein (TIGR03084 family)